MALSDIYSIGTRVRPRFGRKWLGVIVARAFDHNFKADGARIGITRTNRQVTEEDCEVRTRRFGKRQYFHHQTCSPVYWLFDLHQVVIQVTHDSYGKPLRKPLWKIHDMRSLNEVNFD